METDKGKLVFTSINILSSCQVKTVLKEERFRDMAWEAAQAIEQYCKAEYGYAGLANAGSSRPTQDNLQRSFFLAETLK